MGSVRMGVVGLVVWREASMVVGRDGFRTRVKMGTGEMGLRMKICSLLVVAAVLGAGVCSRAQAQLRPDEVLVVYDGRTASSRDVAEYYAGSAKVPGGAGNLAGVRPGVLVMNLANSGAPVAAAGDIAYTDFPVKIRNPIRSYLIANNLTQRVRCLVMTRGLPHRMQDSDVPAIGDDPASLVDEFNSSDVTCASVDSELTLLWIDLNAGENGGAADSKDDGCILNPYWRASLPIGSFTNVNNRAAKTFTASGPGPVWMLGGMGASKLTAGDMLLVTRLDGRSLADVRGMIDRAQNLIYNVNTANVILDESGSDGVADAAANSELDNQGSLPALRSGDDYERARDYMLNTDKRFAPGVIHYDALQDAAHFFVGPRIDFQGQGMLVTGPVALLATYGSNHAGTFPTTASGQSAATIFAESYNYANGAIFNTIESFNGRDYGGIGGQPFIPQEQSSDFIASGGTFAIGHVWEPLADTVPDNEFLVTNYLLGNLSWAEAAWTSIPCLSWSHIVLGDPLARASRTSEDVDGNGRVNVGDLYAWTASPTDIDRSGAADAADRLLLMKTVRFYERGDMENRRP